jgi:HEAT repeat protein/putative zinc finger protein
MGCEEIRHRFADDLRHELPEADRAELRRHLVSCQACREEFESLEQVWSGLGDIPGERPDTGMMRARFDQMLDGHAPGLAAARASSGGWKGINARLAGWWPGWAGQPLVQAGFAAGMLVVGVCAGSLGRAPAAPPQPAADLVELRQELHDMREMLTLSLMQQQSAGERLRGVSGSSQIEQPGTEIVRALLDTLMHDPNVNVRLASVDALRRFAGQDVVRQATIEALGESSFPLVQIALIDFMVETKDKRALDALRRLSEDAMTNEAVRGRAAWGVQQLNL